MSKNSFTIEYPQKERVIKTKCGVCESFDPNREKDHPIVKTYTALWDTGATSSSITKKVIDELNLISTGVTKIYHANGSDTVDTYMVNIILPNNVGFKCLDVTEGKLNGTDVLIGMV